MTNSLDRRLAEHDKGLDPSCCTFSRSPLVLKYQEHYEYVNDAIRKEKQIKRWTRAKKEALINGDFDELIRLAKRRSSLDSAE